MMIGVVIGLFFAITFVPGGQRYIFFHGIFFFLKYIQPHFSHYDESQSSRLHRRLALAGPPRFVPRRNAATEIKIFYLRFDLTVCVLHLNANGPVAGVFDGGRFGG